MELSPQKTNIFKSMANMIKLIEKKPKVVALYGAADTIQYAPWGASGIMLTKGSPGDAYWRKVDYNRDFESLLSITVEDVCDRVQPLMEALTV